MAAYYNEHDAQKAAWLRELMRRNLIAPGEVDERSIEVVQPDELRNFTQCHFFAGIGVWSYALRNAEWSDDARVWTGSCPCPSFSASGKRLGFDDPRHLWPAWFRLIKVSRPDVIFGEQVASDGGLAWLDVVSSDLEGADYAIGAADICAAGVGAPHIRQRLYFVADTERGSTERHGLNVGSATGSVEGEAQKRQRLRDDARNGRDPRGMAHASGGSSTRDPRILGAHTEGEGIKGAEPAHGRNDGVLAHPESERRGKAGREHSGRSEERACDSGQHGELGNSNGLRPQRSANRSVGAEGRETPQRSAGFPGGHGIMGNPELHGSSTQRQPREQEEEGWLREPEGPGTADGFWRDIEWLPCRDGKARPVEPGTFPLAHGAPARVVRLRGYGDAIVAPLAQAFIEAYSEVKSVGGEVA